MQSQLMSVSHQAQFCSLIYPLVARQQRIAMVISILFLFVCLLFDSNEKCEFM